jgi:hypothetical protein
MRTPTVARRTAHLLLRAAICTAVLLAAPFLIDRSTLELVFFHAIALTPVVAVIGGAA